MWRYCNNAVADGAGLLETWTHWKKGSLIKHIMVVSHALFKLWWCDRMFHLITSEVHTESTFCLTAGGRSTAECFRRNRPDINPQAAAARHLPDADLVTSLSPWRLFLFEVSVLYYICSSVYSTLLCCSVLLLWCQLWFNVSSTYSVSCWTIRILLDHQIHQEYNVATTVKSILSY